jgi:hypothetical protein
MKKYKYIILGILIFIIFVFGFWILSSSKSISIVAISNSGNNSASSSSDNSKIVDQTTIENQILNESSTPLQSQLTNPPSVIKGIYLTGWTAGSPAFVEKLIKFMKRTELNAVVIDIKDYSGYVSYPMDVPDVISFGAEKQIRITHINALIKEFHDNGIYVIGRITDFQDPILANAHPEWALKNKKTGAVWKDNNDLSWIDPAAKPAWNYIASIARDAFSRGFDEVNFDYIRFASDGSLGNIVYPYWDQKTPMATVIEGYFQFLRNTFSGKRISVDLFGLSTVDDSGLGIGQVIEDAYKYFDYVCPMVYPSHYANGFIGYKNPAEHPYDVIYYSLTHALGKILFLGNYKTTVASATVTNFDINKVPNTKLRPWLQDFDMGATYTSQMIRQEKQAVYDSLDTASSSKYYGGWLYWNAANTYFTSSTEGSLDKN